MSHCRSNRNQSEFATLTVLCKKIAQAAAMLCGVCLALLPLLPLEPSEAASIKDLRVGSNPNYVRLVLESDQPLNPKPSFSINAETLLVTLTSVDNDLTVGPFEEFNGDIVRLDITKKNGTTRLEAVFSFTPADVKAFSLTTPERFIVDTYRSLSTAESRQKGERASEIESEALLQPLADASTASVPTPPNPSDPLASERDYRSVLSASNVKTDDDKNRLQQRLLATLIGVTSIILALLIFLVFFGSSRKRSHQPNWKDILPLTSDPAIEELDLLIGEHVSALADPDEDEEPASACPSKQLEMITLLHQRSELLSQRLDAVIAALKKSQS